MSNTPPAAYIKYEKQTTLKTITMLDWIHKLFNRCDHHYDLVKEIDLYGSFGDPIPFGSRRVYICSKCLKEKTIEL